MNSETIASCDSSSPSVYRLKKPSRFPARALLFVVRTSGQMLFFRFTVQFFPHHAVLQNRAVSGERLFARTEAGRFGLLRDQSPLVLPLDDLVFVLAKEADDPISARDLVSLW